MKDFQKEYESYMKKVTDRFILMQTESISHEHNDMSRRSIVDWNDGLDWKLVDTEEIRDYNSNIAKKYLISNTLTYDE